MNHTKTFLVVGAFAALSLAGAAWAANPHGTPNNPNPTGQPSQSCEVSGTRPGGAASAPGSAFNPDGTAGMVYAGNRLGAPSTANEHAVSQYDVACFQQP